jgi:hypothetical protein
VTNHVPGHEPHSFGTKAMRWLVQEIKCSGNFGNEIENSNSWD